MARHGWFSKHEHGQLGKRFWRRLHDLLTATEVALSRHCLLELGVPAAAMGALIGRVSSNST